jgi:hypothetical protein
VLEFKVPPLIVIEELEEKALFAPAANVAPVPIDVVPL